MREGSALWQVRHEMSSASYSVERVWIAGCFERLYTLAVASNKPFCREGEERGFLVLFC